jgi:hypothetical protein
LSLRPEISAVTYPSRYGAADRRRLSTFYGLLAATFLLALFVGGLFVVLAARSGATPF